MKSIIIYVRDFFIPLCFQKLECFLCATTISSRPLATRSKGKWNKREWNKNKEYKRKMNREKELLKKGKTRDMTDVKLINNKVRNVFMQLLWRQPDEFQLA